MILLYSFGNGVVFYCSLHIVVSFDNVKYWDMPCVGSTIPYSTFMESWVFYFSYVAVVFSNTVPQYIVYVVRIQGSYRI